MSSTRMSTRVRVVTSKAKQLQEMAKKPVLRSITTIGENENTYNNVNFKRRKLDQHQVDNVAQPRDQLNVVNYNTSIDDDDDEEENAVFNNSDEEEYYSALSDYDVESDASNTRFLSFKRPSQEEDCIHQHIHLSQSKLMEDSLFETSESESDSPITPVASFMHTFSELKSFEENFQKIIDENNKAFATNTPSATAPSSPSSSNSFDEQLTVEDFLNYTGAPENTSPANMTPKRKFLQYRHDERHNLAFPDVSTFPVRFDPANSILQKKKGKTIRALNRRAILSGKASEMVGTGLTLGDWAF